MARPTKRGLDYFPLDVHFYNDIKVRKLIRSQGGKAVAIYTLLLCFIYENGYCVSGDKDFVFFISEILGFEETYIQQVINNCVSLGLLDKDMFEKEGVLTSRSIQERYLAVRRLARNRKFVITDFNLVEKPPLCDTKPQLNPSYATQNPAKPQLCDTKPPLCDAKVHKVKQNKTKQNKEEVASASENKNPQSQKPSSSPSIPSFDSVSIPNMETRYDPEIVSLYHDVIAEWNDIAGTLEKQGHVVRCPLTMDGAKHKIIIDFLESHTDEEISAFLTNIDSSAWLRQQAAEHGYRWDIFKAIEHGEKVIAGNYTKVRDI